MTSLMHSLSTIFGLGITQGMYNIGRCLFVCVTATLSADIPSVDALTYHLALRMSVGSADSL